MANPSVETVNTSSDKLMLVAGVLLVLAGFVGFFWLNGQEWYVRGAALAVGLIAGVATAVKAKFPQAQVIVAEPKDYDDHSLSLKAGHREAHHAAVRTICDALMAAMPGELTFAINSKLLANGVTASDEEVGAAVAYAYRELKLVVEPGGAIGLAALLAGRIDVKGKNVVIVLSGGNVDADLFSKLVA